jgi:putative membrane protein
MESLQTDLPRTLVALALVAVLAAGYWRGAENARTAGLEQSLNRLRVAAFTLGLLALFVALSGPVEAAGASWLMAVVGQQQVLALVAAPLLLLGSPRWAFTLALPAGLRRWALGGGSSSGLVGRAARALFAPLPLLVLYLVASSVWYAPPIFDATLRSGPLRAVMQASVLVTALLFWAQVIPSRPARPRLNYVLRALYLGGAGLWSSMIGAFYMYSVSPFYARRWSISIWRGQCSTFPASASSSWGWRR